MAFSTVLSIRLMNLMTILVQGRFVIVYKMIGLYFFSVSSDGSYCM